MATRVKITVEFDLPMLKGHTADKDVKASLYAAMRRDDTFIHHAIANGETVKSSEWDRKRKATATIRWTVY